MYKQIPIDVWIAAALAIVVCVLEFFDPIPAIFIICFVGLCVYIAVQTITNEID